MKKWLKWIIGISIVILLIIIISFLPLFQRVAMGPNGPVYFRVNFWDRGIVY